MGYTYTSDRYRDFQDRSNARGCPKRFCLATWVAFAVIDEACRERAGTLLER